jgi:NAD(P)-dependent dehydrogenase (short-subunit alcohol dehydrogenase family)
MPAVVVTGGTGTIGRAICLRLARDGFDVGINCLPDAESVAHAQEFALEVTAATSARTYVIAADVSDEDQVTDMIGRAADFFGDLSGLVCNAATAVARIVDWRDLPESDWTEVLRTNVMGPYWCARAALDHLVRSGRGSIVMMSSVTALVGAPQNLSYVTSKAALIGMTRALAREIGPTGVRVNAIAPGAIVTPAESVFGRPDEVGAVMKDRQSLTRRGLPEDIAGTTAFLLGPDSDFMTGQVLSVDGGWAMH